MSSSLKNLDVMPTQWSNLDFLREVNNSSGTHSGIWIIFRETENSVTFRHSWNPLISIFREIDWVRPFYKMWKNGKFTVTQIFFLSNQLFSNFFSKNQKTLIWRNFCQRRVTVSLSNFHYFVNLSVLFGRTSNFNVKLYLQCLQ